MKLQKIYREVPWCMLFVDDLELVGKNRKEVNQILDIWRLTLVGKRLRFNRSKTKHIEYEFDKREKLDEIRSGMIVGRDEIKEVESFKYLGSVV